MASVPGRSVAASGPFLGRLEAILGRSWPLLACPGRPQIGLGATLGRPKAVPSASERVPETVLGAQTGPRSIFRRFFVDFDFILVDFPAFFRGFSLKPPATKTQNQSLKKESRDPHCASWLLRCAVASFCPYVFPNGLRTLHVQPFFVAYPQAHLVYIYIYGKVLPQEPSQ